MNVWFSLSAYFHLHRKYLVTDADKTTVFVIILMNFFTLTEIELQFIHLFCKNFNFVIYQHCTNTQSYRNIQAIRVRFSFKRSYTSHFHYQ